MDLMNWSLIVSDFVLHWVIQSSLLILVGLVAARLLRKRGAAFQSAIYRTTLMAACVCPFTTWGLSQTEFSGWAFRFPDAWKTEQVTQAHPQPIIDLPSEPTAVNSATTALDVQPQAAVKPLAATVPSQTAPNHIPSNPQATPSTEINQRSQPLPTTAENESLGLLSPVEAPSPPRALTGSTMSRPYLPVTVCLWLAISLFLLFRLFMGHWKMSGIRRMAVLTDESTLEVCQELSRALQVKKPQVLSSPFLPGPCLTGLIRPAILLPEDSKSLSIREVLIHELAHLRRHDCHWNLLRHVATSLLFFNPCLWYLSRKIETSAEEVCDDFVVKFGGDRQRYANRLVDIAEHSSVPVSPAGVGLISFRSVLVTRVNRILDTSRKISTQVGNLHKTLLISGGLAGAVAAGFVGLRPDVSNQDDYALISLKSTETTTVSDQNGSIVPQLAGAIAVTAKTTPPQNQDDSADWYLAYLEDEGVQYFKPKLRYSLDRVVFPPADKGSREPGVFVLPWGLTWIFGPRSSDSRLPNLTLKELEARPEVFLKVIKRLEKWSPDYPADYKPRWKYTHRLDKAAVAKEVANAREKLLSALRNKTILLNDPRYRDAWVKLQESEKRRKSASLSHTRLLEWRDTLRRERMNIHLVHWELFPEYRWHAKVGWKAEDYFTDPRVIELCQAIEVDDLKRMQELIDQGANVNAIGKDNMTPLLWSYPDLKFERFKMLLEAGANPNVIVAATVRPQEHDPFDPVHPFHPNLLHFADTLYIPVIFNKGSSVNLMAYQTRNTRYWRAVIKHGGDVNQIDPSNNCSLLHLALYYGRWLYASPGGRAEKMAAVMALVKGGANLNALDRAQQPPLSLAITNEQYEIATFLVQSGAMLNGRPVKRNGKYELVNMPPKAGRNEPRATGRERTPVELVEDLKPFGSVGTEKYRAEQRVRQQALHDAMVQRGAIFKTDQVRVDRRLAKIRMSRLRKLMPSVSRKQNFLPGSAKAFTFPKSYRYRSEDYQDPAQYKEFQKYYSQVSPDFSKPSDGVNFSIKHVSTDQLKDFKTSLPEFVAIGNKDKSEILIAPSFSGHSDWLTVHGGIWEDYLRHLAVKKCNLLNRSSADFPELATNTDGYYFVEVANDKRRNELLIPAQYLRDKTLRQESGLEAFGEIWKILDDFKMRAFLGNQQRTGTVVAAINKQRKSQFPEAAFRFYIEHLTSAKFDANGSLQCTFEFSETGTDLKYIASCKRNRWADDSKPRKRLAELEKEKATLLRARPADRSKLQKVREELNTLKRITSQYQLTVEITRHP